MSDGDATLDRMIESLLKTPDALKEVMPKLAAIVKRHVLEANAAGVSPDDKPYQLTQEGHVPLRHGAQAIKVTTAGISIVVRVRGVEALHSTGAARGNVERRMLPEGAPPPAMLRDLEREVEKHLREILD